MMLKVDLEAGEMEFIFCLLFSQNKSFVGDNVGVQLLSWLSIRLEIEGLLVRDSPPIESLSVMSISKKLYPLLSTQVRKSF